MRARTYATALLTAGLIAAGAAPAFAQMQGQCEGQSSAPSQRSQRNVQPYIEVAQVVSAQISPGNDVVTFTQIAAGVDINVQSRNSAAAVSVRYERNIGYGDNSVDANTVNCGKYQAGIFNIAQSHIIYVNSRCA
jgi:hypothetical protein